MPKNLVPQFTSISCCCLEVWGLILVRPQYSSHYFVLLYTPLLVCWLTSVFTGITHTLPHTKWFFGHVLPYCIIPTTMKVIRDNISTVMLFSLSEHSSNLTTHHATRIVNPWVDNFQVGLPKFITCVLTFMPAKNRLTIFRVYYFRKRLKMATSSIWIRYRINYLQHNVYTHYIFLIKNSAKFAICGRALSISLLRSFMIFYLSTSPSVWHKVNFKLS